MRLALVLLALCCTVVRGQSDESNTDAAAAGAGTPGAADSSGGATPVTTGPAPVDIWGPYRGPVTTPPAGAAATGSSDQAAVGTATAPPIATAPAPPAGATPYVWKMGAPGVNSAALNSAFANAPHAPPSWMLKKWPPRPPSPPAPPAPPPPNFLTFLGIADWGGETQWPPTTAAQLQCAQTMPAVVQNQAVTMIISAGDNFYDDGISGPIDGPVAQARFNQTWATPYNVATMQLPWYVVAGNHDWEGNVSAEVAATNVYPMWHMPSLYYTFTQLIPTSTQTVQFVMIDTESLVGGDAGQYDSAPADIVQPPVDETQWAWVTETLATSTADWLVVVGHFPVYSVGENGPTAMLVSRLLPLMDAAGVAVYICGHDHSLQHIAPATGSEVDFVVTGAGAKYNWTMVHADAIPAGTLKYQYGVGCGFATFQITREGFQPSSLVATFWENNGNVLYSFTKSNPRQKFQPPAPPRPPHPPSVFRSPSNRLALGVGFCGIMAGCVVIFSGLAKMFEDGPGAGPAVAPRPPPGGAGVVIDRGEKAGMLLSQRGMGYGGVSSATSSAFKVTNRL